MLRRRNRPDRDPRRRSRWIFWPGVGLILVGLAMLGYVAWEYWGTNWVSERHQHQARHQLQQSWVSGQRIARTPWGDADALVRIPRFGANYAVPVFAGTSPSVLAAGFGHFTGTAAPGQVGNYVLAAHRVTHGEPLRHMPDLRAGDLIYVDTQDRTYTYRLTSGGADLIVPMTSTWVTDPLPTNPDGGVQPAQNPGQRLITLTTCSELFHTDNRMIAFGVLVTSRAR